MSCSAWKSLLSDASQWRSSAARTVRSSISISVCYFGSTSQPASQLPSRSSRKLRRIGLLRLLAYAAVDRVRVGADQDASATNWPIPVPLPVMTANFPAKSFMCVLPFQLFSLGVASDRRLALSTRGPSGWTDTGKRSAGANEGGRLRPGKYRLNLLPRRESHFTGGIPTGGADEPL